MDIQKVTRQVRLRQWINLINQCQNSGKNVRDWCSTQGIKPRMYYYWLKRARESACLEMEAYQSQPLQQQVSEIPVFAEVGRLSGKSAAITIHIAGVEVEIHNGADAGIITNTIQALRNIC